MLHKAVENFSNTIVGLFLFAPIWLTVCKVALHYLRQRFKWVKEIGIILSILVYTSAIPLQLTLITKLYPNVLLVDTFTQFFSLFWIIGLLWAGKKGGFVALKKTYPPRDSHHKSLYQSSEKFASILLIITSILMVLRFFKAPIGPLLAFGGIGGLAISWAAKDIIANLFGGLMLYLHRAFTEGDVIISPNKKFSGTVVQIGWYGTELKTFDQLPLFVPNATITDAIIENLSRIQQRRILFTIGIRYNDLEKIPQVVAKIKEELEKDTTLLMPPLVHFISFNDHSLDIEVRVNTTYTSFADFRSKQEQLLLLVGSIVENCGAQLALPTRTIIREEV